MPADAKVLIKKIEALTEERITEIEDCVDFMRWRELGRAITHAAAANASSFAAVLCNPEDDVYEAF